MGVNRHLPHIYILPEDDANRQLALGFLTDTSAIQVRILNEAGGWTHVRDLFASVHVDEMRRFDGRYMILLVDFDGDVDRLRLMKEAVPTDLADRVFVLGTLTQPEHLRKDLGPFENIGKLIADDCRNGTQTVRTHDLLRHNDSEFTRLRHALHAILFP